MKGGLRKKMRSEIDRARQHLSGTIIGFVGTGVEANRFQKYSNPDLKYLTSFSFISHFFLHLFFKNLTE